MQLRSRWALVLLALSWSPPWIPPCSADLSSWGSSFTGLRIDGPAKELYESMSNKFQANLDKGKKFFETLQREDREDSTQGAQRGEVLYELTGEGRPVERNSIDRKLEGHEEIMDHHGMWTSKAALHKYLDDHRALHEKLLDNADRDDDEDTLWEWFDVEGMMMRVRNRIKELEVLEQGGMDHPDGPRFDLRTLPCYNEDDDEISSTVGEVRDPSGEEGQDEEDEADDTMVDKEEAERVAEHDRHLDYLSNPFGVPRGPREVIDPKPQDALSKEEQELEECIAQGLEDVGISRYDVLSNYSRELPEGVYPSPYHPAVKKRFNQFMSKYKTVERDPGLRTKQEWLVLNWHFFKACRRGDVRSMQMLLDIGAPIDARDELWEDTPLHEAAGAGRTEAVKLLLDLGADVRAVTSEGWTPLHMAAATGNAEVVRMLLERGADADAHAGKPYGHSPLDVAKCYGFYAPHPVGSSIMAAGGRITPANWHEEVEREQEEVMRQRARISEETGGKMSQPGPAFKPKAWSLTVELGTRDARDPNRYGHIKRSQLDSIDLLQFRHIEYDKDDDARQRSENSEEDVMDRVAGDLVGEAPSRPRQPYPRLRRGARGEAREAPRKLRRGSEGGAEEVSGSEEELPGAGASSPSMPFGGMDSPFGGMDTQVGGQRRGMDADEDMFGLGDDEADDERARLTEADLSESESDEGVDEGGSQEAAAELMQDQRFGAAF